MDKLGGHQAKEMAAAMGRRGSLDPAGETVQGRRGSERSAKGPKHDIGI